MATYHAGCTGVWLVQGMLQQSTSAGLLWVPMPAMPASLTSFLHCWTSEAVCTPLYFSYFQGMSNPTRAYKLWKSLDRLYKAILPQVSVMPGCLGKQPANLAVSHGRMQTVPEVRIHVRKFLGQDLDELGPGGLDILTVSSFPIFCLNSNSNSSNNNQ
jgi:hypothetical protein